MKKICLLFITMVLFFCKPLFLCAATDSLRVEICQAEGSLCFGFNYYHKTIEHINNDGDVVEINFYNFSGCEGIRDTAFLHTNDAFFIYDSLHQAIVSTTVNYYNGDTTEYRSTYAYDSFGNVISRRLDTYDSGSYYNTYFDTIAYSQTNKLEYEFSQQLNTITLVFDTVRYTINTYDALYHLINSSIYNGNPQFTNLNDFIYDVDTNLISEHHSTDYNSTLDSNQTTYSYDTNHNVLVSTDQKWDTLLLQWNNINRSEFSYGINDYKVEYISSYWDQSILDWVRTRREHYMYIGAGLVSMKYIYTCPDSTCSDTLSKVNYYYDSSGRTISIQDSLQTGSSFQISMEAGTVYNSADLLVSDYYWIHQDGCDESEHYTNTYNSLNQLVHSSHTRYTCEYSNTEYDIYNLNKDSILVIAAYPFTVCQNDTMQPWVTVAGGIPPYTYSWSPSARIVDPSVETPSIIADTIQSYTLFVTDSLGLTQQGSFELQVSCFTNIDSPEENESFTIYPNPANDILKIVSLKDEKFLLSDSFGKIILAGKTSDGEINITSLSSGIYFIRVGMETRKIVKL